MFVPSFKKIHPFKKIHALRRKLAQSPLFIFLSFTIFSTCWNLWNAFDFGKGHDPASSTEATTIAIESSKKKSGSQRQIKPHPFGGALYPDGTYGYVVDPTAVRRHILGIYVQYQQSLKNKENNKRNRPDIHPRYTFLPVNSSLIDKACGSLPDRPGPDPYGKEVMEIDGYNLMMERVQVNSPDPIALNISNASLFKVNTVPVPPPSVPSTNSRILCVVYTQQGSKRSLQVVIATWGWRCDGFFAANTMTQMDDPHADGFGSVNLIHKGDETYENMWQKTRSILAYLYEHFLHQYEYFYLCGDDTLVLVENMKNFLASVEKQHEFSSPTTTTKTRGHFLFRSQKARIVSNGKNRTHDNYPLYLGRPCPPPRDKGFYSRSYADGGSGYVLNRAALKEFVEKALDSCGQDERDSGEDVYLGYCLDKIGITIKATNDIDAQMRHRLHVTNPNYLARESGTHWAEGRVQKMDGMANLGFRIRHDVVSTQSVSFHVVRSTIQMLRFHVVMYRVCPRGTVLGEALWSFDQNQKPTLPRDLEILQTKLMNHT